MWAKVCPEEAYLEGLVVGPWCVAAGATEYASNVYCVQIMWGGFLRVTVAIEWMQQ